MKNPFKLLVILIMILSVSPVIAEKKKKAKAPEVKPIKAGQSPTTKEKDTMGAPCPKGGIVLFGKDGKLDNMILIKKSKKKGEEKGKEEKWEVKDGVLTIKPKSGDMFTKMDVNDFHMHLEFNVNEGGKGQGMGNSGVYIQKRYELQILNSFGKESMEANDCGGIYKYKPADINACRKAGEWQVYDIFFQAAKWDSSGKKTANARITVIQNGWKIHNDVEIPDKTGSGDKESPDAAPIKLQDHKNPVKFRNIWIVLKK